MIMIKVNRKMQDQAKEELRIKETVARQETELQVEDAFPNFIFRLNFRIYVNW